jgi:hypothetical protein
MRMSHQPFTSPVVAIPIHSAINANIRNAPVSYRKNVDLGHPPAIA